MNGKEYRLKHQITDVTKKPVMSVVVRRITVADMRALDPDSSDMEQMAQMIGRLCGLDISEVDSLDLEDFMGIQEIVKKYQGGQK